MTYIPMFFVKQHIALTVNRFDILAANPDGTMGGLICSAQQKRMALKERVTFFADAERTRPVFSFGARNIMELNGTYDIFDEFGRPLATFRKDFAKSLWRSTYHIEGPGYQGTGQERLMWVAMLRRFSDFPFLPIDFEYKDVAGNMLFEINRQFSARDKYVVTVPDQRIDFRVAASMAVAMDVLMGR